MTNTTEIIVSKIAELRQSKRLKESIIKKAYHSLYADILEITSYMDDAKFNERIYHIENGLSARPICPTCNTNYCEWFYDYARYKQCCSHACFLKCPDRFNKIQKTLSEKYGSISAFGNRDIQEKSRNTIKRKYGVDHVMQDVDIKKKQRDSNRLSTGYENNFDNPIIRENIKNLFISKYGVSNVFGSGWKRDEITQKILSKYGVDNFNKTKISSDARLLLEDEQWLRTQIEVNKLPFYEIGYMLDCDPTTISNWAKKFAIDASSQKESYLERKIYDALVARNVNNITRHDRELIAPLELDFVFHDKKIAIEVCGNYWHSDKFKDKNYHRNKFKKCEEAGYQLLTIYEDEINEKFNIVISSICDKLGVNTTSRVYARKTNIVHIDKQKKKVFLNDNHIQGNDKSTHAYGLTCDSVVVALLSIQEIDQSIIISRYATSCKVIGGFSKLLKYVKQLFPNKPMITFADLRWSTGALYEKHGFTLSHYVPVSYYYIKRDKRFHKFNFRKSFMIKKFNQNRSLTEREMAKNIGLHRLYDCGKKQYTLS